MWGEKVDLRTDVWCRAQANCLVNLIRKAVSAEKCCFSSKFSLLQSRAVVRVNIVTLQGAIYCYVPLVVIWEARAVLFLTAPACYFSQRTIAILTLYKYLSSGNTFLSPLVSVPSGGILLCKNKWVFCEQMLAVTKTLLLDFRLHQKRQCFCLSLGFMCCAR